MWLFRLGDNMMEIVKNSKNGKVNIKTGNFSCVMNHTVYNENISNVDDEVGFWVIKNFEQVESDFELIKKSLVYEYVIWNGYDYEMSSETSVYSQNYYTKEEFNNICQEVIKNIDSEYISEFQIANEMEKRDDFCSITFAQCHNHKIDEIAKKVIEKQIDSYKDFVSYMKKNHQYENADDVKYYWKEIEQFYL